MSVAAHLLAMAGLAWSGWFLVVAFQRWRFEVFCSMACGPFVPVELVAEFRRLSDWQSPLLLACVPLVLLCGGWLWHRRGWLMRRPLDHR